jgi:hypothetical protein
MPTTLTIKLKPKVHYCTSGMANGYGTQPAPGTATEVEADCSAYVNEGQDALDETGYGWLRSSATPAAYTAGRFEFSYGGLPPALTITKVRLVAYLRTGNNGAAIIDESPRVKGFVNPAGTRYYQTGPTYVTVSAACNRNTEAAAGSFERLICGEWATNPATASAWVLADLVEGIFKAGIEAGGVAEGQAGDGVPPTSGGSGASLDLAEHEVEVECTSTELIVDPIRTILSRLLRLRRRPLRPVRLEVPAPLAHVSPGDIVYAAEPFYPTPGATGLSALSWDRRPLFVLEAEERVSMHAASLVAWDLREHLCSCWSPLHTDLGADDQWTGLAYVDQGGGKEVTRAQGGWIWRPGDNLWRDAASGKWRITPWGLIVCGGTFSGSEADTGEETWYPTNATFSQGTGGEGTSLAGGDTAGFTGWTVGQAGAGTVVVKQDSSYLLDVATYRRAARLTQGAPYGTNYARLYSSTSTFTSTQRVRVHLKFRVVTGSYANVAWRIVRTTGSNEWDETARTWGASVWNLVNAGLGTGLGSLLLSGDHYEYWSSEILVGGGATETLRIHIGIQEDGGSIDVFDFGFVCTGAPTLTDAKVPIRREFLAPTTVALTQAADIVDVVAGSFPFLMAPQGTFTLMATPLWDHEELVDGARKYLATFRYGTTYYDTVFYERTDATTGKWCFFPSVFAGSSQAEFATSAAAGTLPRYFSPVKISVRWTSATVGELGLAANSLTIHVNGVASAVTAAPGAVSATAASFVALGRLADSGTKGSSDDARRYFDGILAHLEVLPFCLSDTEIARRHAHLSLPELPAAP